MKLDKSLVLFSFIGVSISIMSGTWFFKTNNDNISFSKTLTREKRFAFELKVLQTRNQLSKIEEIIKELKSSIQIEESQITNQKLIKENLEKTIENVGHKIAKLEKDSQNHENAIKKLKTPRQVVEEKSKKIVNAKYLIEELKKQIQELQSGNKQNSVNKLNNAQRNLVKIEKLLEGYKSAKHIVVERIKKNIEQKEKKLQISRKLNDNLSKFREKVNEIDSKIKQLQKKISRENKILNETNEKKNLLEQELNRNINELIK